MNILIKSIILFSFLFLVNVNYSYSQILGSRDTKAYHVEQNGLKYVDVKTYLKNNSDKTVKKINVSVVFRDKRYSSSDITAPTEVKEAELEINILSTFEKQATFRVFEPRDINFVYSYAMIERITYSDGSVVDL